MREHNVEEVGDEPAHKLIDKIHKERDEADNKAFSEISEAAIAETMTEINERGLTDG
jgi:hypothetical protein